MWARKGYSAAEIQKEMDVKYDELLTKSHEVQKEAKLDAEQDLSTENAEQTHPQSLEDEQGEKSWRFNWLREVGVVTMCRVNKHVITELALV